MKKYDFAIEKLQAALAIFKELQSEDVQALVYLLLTKISLLKEDRDYASVCVHELDTLIANTSLEVVKIYGDIAYGLYLKGSTRMDKKEKGFGSTSGTHGQKNAGLVQDIGF